MHLSQINCVHYCWLKQDYLRFGKNEKKLSDFLSKILKKNSKQINYIITKWYSKKKGESKASYYLNRLCHNVSYAHQHHILNLEWNGCKTLVVPYFSIYFFVSNSMIFTDTYFKNLKPGRLEIGKLFSISLEAIFWIFTFFVLGHCRDFPLGLPSPVRNLLTRQTCSFLQNLD